MPDRNPAEERGLMRWMLFFGTFFFIYSPALVVGGVTFHVPEYYLFLLALVGLGLVMHRGFPAELLALVLFIGLGFFYVLTGSLVTGNLDSLIAIQYMKAIAAVVGGYGLAVGYLRIDGHNEGGLLLAHIFLAGVIHGLIMIAAFFVPTVRDALYSVVLLNEAGRLFVDSGIRSPGLTTGGGDALSVIQAITVVCGLTYLLRFERRAFVPVAMLYTLAFGVLLISILLSARTGFVVLALASLMLVAYLSAELLRATMWRWARVIAMAVITAACLVPIVIWLGQSEYARFYARAFEVFINLQETGAIRTSSTDVLLDMYFLPSSSAMLWFGSGNFGRSEGLEYIASDVGYVRTIFGAGIVGTVLMFSYLAYVLFVTLERVHIPHLSMVLVFLIATTLLVNLKVLHVFSLGGTLQVLVVLFLYSALYGRLIWVYERRLIGQNRGTGGGNNSRRREVGLSGA